MDYLLHGVRIQWEVSGETVKTIEDLNGAIKGVVRERFHKQHTEKRGCPSWVFDRILGKNTAVMDALQVLLSENIATPEQARIVRDGIAQIEQRLKEAQGQTYTD